MLRLSPGGLQERQKTDAQQETLHGWHMATRQALVLPPSRNRAP